MKVINRRVAARVIRALRHPFAAVFLAAAVTAAAVIATFLLIVVPLVTAVTNAPGQFGRAYVTYYNDVGQQIQQAQKEGGTP
jgi:hypothetical protein